jgi:hypothetical protein
MASGHFAGDIKLVRQQLHPRAQQTLDSALLQAAQVIQGFPTQDKAAVIVDLAGEKTILGLAELHKAVEIEFVENHLAAALIETLIKDPAVQFLYGSHLQNPAFITAQTVAKAVLHPVQGGVIHGVKPLLANGGKTDLHPAVDALHHDSQARLRFRTTDPTLAGQKNKFAQGSNPSLLGAAMIPAPNGDGTRQSAL